MGLQAGINEMPNDDSDLILLQKQVNCIQWDDSFLSQGLQQSC